ncbi:MAG: hypothetical protein A2066_00190 [Bacteroidetes bacterium GWB2_41_8]|nr:MAG: hypothetical protein A2066_00190 [Bacteroidetes bacterium GWB2_41_8]
MSKKNGTATMELQKGENTPKSEVNNLPVVIQEPETKPEQTPEELKAENEQLKKQLSAIPQDLKTRVEYFSKKNELIRRLSKLDADKESLNIHLDKLAEIAAANEFDNEEYYLNIEGGGRYNKSAVYTVKNPVIIGELISFIIGRVDAKREVLKNEIEA